MKKRVSIVIPVYNGSNYLKEAIDSALQQTYSNYEVIVVNDGSDDNGATREIALSYGKKIRYFEKENGGVSSALNLAIDHMTGDYFSWLSHDDLYYPNKLERQMQEVEKYDDHTIFYSDVDVIDENGVKFDTARWNHPFLMLKPDYAVLRGSISGITLLIPKKAFDEYGKFDENYRCVQDYLKWFEMLATYRFIHIDEVLAMSREHKKQVTKTSPKVLSEGNWLWSYMVDHYPDEKKIEYEGSIYLFYKEMAKFLKTTIYEDACNHVLKEMDLLYNQAKKEFRQTNITVFIIDHGNSEDLNTTIKSILSQNISHYTIIIEGKTKIKGYSNTKNREESIKHVKTEYFTFLNAGVVASKDWLKEQLIQAKLTKKSLVISDYPRVLPHNTIDNLCSYLIPIDGVIIKKNNIPYTDMYSYFFQLGFSGGSFIEDVHYLENIPFDVPIENAFQYLNLVLNSKKASDYEVSALCYDIACIYNQKAPYAYKIAMYDDCDELKEIKYSRSYQYLKKYIQRRKRKKGK